MVIFLLGFTTFVGAIHYYLWHRLLRATRVGDRLKRLGTRIIVGFGIAMPSAMFLVQILPRPLGAVASFVVYTWMGFAGLLASFLIAAEVPRLAVALTSRLLSGQPIDASRRTFLSRIIAGIAGVFTLGLSGAGVAEALGEVALKRVKVALRKWPKELAGMRIVQLTDVHIGPMIGREWLEGIVARVNELDADIVVITGDLVDGSVEALREHVAPLAQLRSKRGVYFVTGNHEYYSGVKSWVEHLGQLGLRVLRNEHVTIGEGAASFDLAGVDDHTGSQFDKDHGVDVAKALAGRDPTRECILLAHQPKEVIDAAKFGVGLQISGHTHGGQVFPATLLVRLQQPFVAGLDRLGDTQIYVSRGTGYWGPPMRVGAPAEIAVIEVVPEVV
ncbi:MAG: metallophosphoesterase [Polyangiaceae bacterium]|nr:metallophosphoesterase [Polyangiaceae bacterium]